MKEWKTLECNQDYLEENLNWLEKSGFYVHEIFQSKVLLNQPEFHFLIVGAKEVTKQEPEKVQNKVNIEKRKGYPLFKPMDSLRNSAKPKIR